MTHDQTQMAYTNCNTDIESSELSKALLRYRHFIITTVDGDYGFCLTTRSEVSPYARCFALFGLNLLRDIDSLLLDADGWASAICGDLDRFRSKRLDAGANLSFDKPYLQLLTFSLSALSIIRRIDQEPLREHVVSIVCEDVAAYLHRIRALDGVAGTGNLAMFMAILLIHARDHLGMDTQDRLDTWCDLHLRRMNHFGFWGAEDSMSHLQFQNGYHQYEILEYLGVENPKAATAADAVASLADDEGHFAPYPGGGGCYDYDAVFVLTSAGPEVVAQYRDLLIRTTQTILSEQNTDGGFCESHRVRPRSFDNLARSVKHVFSAHGRARLERLRQAITLLRPKHDCIHTHWSAYSREWGESDLWDSWFRMLAIARIDVALDPSRASEWGFIDYPGIGYHPSLHIKGSS